MNSALLIYQEGRYKQVLDRVAHLVKGSYQLLIRERECLTPECHQDVKLIVVVGGDGTFLRASHLNKDAPMFGINPEPSRKEGFYMQSTSKDYEKKLPRVLKGDYTLKKFLRLMVSINGVTLNELVLNDAYLGDPKAYKVFNYDLRINRLSEYQRSSGVIVGTPTGSHAWLKSAGGELMPSDSKSFQYLPRELYNHKIIKGYKLKGGILHKQDEFELTAKSQGIVVIDSVSHEYPLAPGDRVKINIGAPLNYIE